MIRDKHLLVYYSPDNELHIGIDELNELDCISLPAAVYDQIKGELIGFNDSRAWNLSYDFGYIPPAPVSYLYDIVDFDFENQYHYVKATELINQGGEWLTDKNIRHMMKYSAFDPSLWFFVEEKESKELIAVSISEYSEEVRQTDIDWVYVAPGRQGKGAGRFLIEKTIERCKGKSDDICVGGTVDFYKKCGFYDYELWVWAPKDGYRFTAPAIQP
jgi:GNAT superfamily N-acetyltransferase